ncbi:MAG: septum formation initiator family protein [Candidatus Paracaedibacteraceae bacterium]|nr:septum formation initiator family protein [Candidatus Paracaedibacteraceae bacterium]
MSIQSKKRFSLRQIFIPLISIIIMGYFTYHIFQGDRGIIAYLRLQQTVALNEKKFASQQIVREQLERRVYLLRPDSLDIDLLEERARAVLNFAHQDEIVINNSSVGVQKKPVKR